MVPCTARSLIRLATLASVALWLIATPVPAQTVDIKKTHAEFSMEFRDAEIKDVLRAVGQAANLNMIVSDAVSGKVSLSIKDVDIWYALESILKTKGLTYVRDGNMVRVLSVSEARDHDMDTRVFPLHHAKSKDILPIIKSDNPSAKISEDSRMNALVIRDLSLNLDRVARLLKDLDVKMPQVLIEAKIVEVSSNYIRELGVQWGGQYSGTSTRGTTVMSGGTTGGSTVSASPLVGSNAFYPLTGDIGPSGNAYVVNLPANVGAGSGGALGISFGKLGGKLALDLQLSAMQTTGNGRILSSPKVMTMNNKEARISSGTDIPIRTVSSTANTTGGSINTASVQMISASLALSAVPTITNDNRIAMTIKVEKSEPDFSHQVDGIPTIAKRDATSEVVMNNGETIVLGGILTKSEGESESGVPFLSKIPILGWLFKKKSTFDNQSELMIFITTTIMSE
ncbi:MAG: type IV pilus secretin PilQ [Nitrospirae bacterium]|nr:type IV pilus secretin PilQ [Nitrospirota bacterium]